MTLFSRRNAAPPSQLRYDVPGVVRSRIAAILQHHVDARHESGFLLGMEDLLTRQYGHLSQSSYRAARRSDIAVIEHLFTCSHEQVLDFIEACFRLNISCGGQDAVNEINDVFRQEGLGYELTHYFAEPLAKGESRIGPPIPDDQLPRIIRVDNQRMHVEVVLPSLEFLSNPMFKTANTELLKAFSDYRSQRHEDAITACSSAFESVLKTICGKKGWKYDADKVTCDVLVDVCRKNGLFPPFYVELFKRVGTIRNKLGGAHGRGPTPLHVSESAHAEHALHMTSAHIILLCKLAKLE